MGCRRPNSPTGQRARYRGEHLGGRWWRERRALARGAAQSVIKWRPRCDACRPSHSAARAHRGDGRWCPGRARGCPAVAYSEAVGIVCAQRGSQGTGGGRCCSSARLLGPGVACRCVPERAERASECSSPRQPAGQPEARGPSFPSHIMALAATPCARETLALYQTALVLTATAAALPPRRLSSPPRRRRPVAAKLGAPPARGPRELSDINKAKLRPSSTRTSTTLGQSCSVPQQPFLARRTSPAADLLV